MKKIKELGAFISFSLIMFSCSDEIINEENTSIQVAAKSVTPMTFD